MKVLFFEYDDRFIFGLPLGFRDAGHKILVSGSLTEAKIHRLLHEFGPDLVVLLGWTLLHTDTNIYAIQEACHNYKVPVIYWATEDPTFTDSFSIPLIQKLKPDYVFTVASSKIATYEALGYPALYLPFAYQPSICKQSRCSDWCSKSIAVVANAYPNVLYAEPTHYRRTSIHILIKPLLEQCIPIDFWGKHWDEMQPYLGLPIHPKHIHGYLHYLKAPSVYHCSQIILGLQNYRSHVITMRTYEILGSGGFLITSFNEELARQFNHTKELILSTSPEETIDYVNHYKKHPESMTSIRANATKAVEKHTYGCRAKTIIDTLQKAKVIP